MSEHEPELEVCDHERGGEYLEPEDALDGGLFEALGHQGIAAFFVQGVVNAAQGFDEIGAGAATGVEDHHVVVGQPVGDLEFVAQDAIDAFDLVRHDLGGRIPDAEFFAQFGVVGFQEGLVEILDGMLFLEALEELGLVHAVQRHARPIEDLGDPEGLQFVRHGDLREQGGDHGDMQGPGRRMPVEFALVVFAAPQHPRRKHAVEQRLHQGCAEEVIAFFALEFEPEGLFQGRAQDLEGGQAGGFLDPGPRLARVGGQKPGQFLGLIEGRVMQHDPPKEILEPVPELVRRLAGMRRLRPELLFRLGDAEGFEFDRLVVPIAADEDKVAVVCHQDLPVMSPVFGHLGALCRDEGIIGQPFDLDHAALRLDPRHRFLRFAVLKLIFGIQPEIRASRAGIRDLGHTADPRLEFSAGFIKQIAQCGIIRRFRDRAAGRMRLLQVLQVLFDWMHARPRRGTLVVCLLHNVGKPSPEPPGRCIASIA